MLYTEGVMTKTPPTKADWLFQQTRWENDPDLSISEVARTLGVSQPSTSRYAKRNGWRKLGLEAVRTKEQARVALAVAVAAEELPASPAPSIPSTAIRSVIHTPETEHADAATRVLDRHRREWAIPRQMLTGAYTINDGRIVTIDKERVTAARMAASALRDVQAGEREAWGIESGAEKARGGPLSVTVTFEDHRPPDARGLARVLEVLPIPEGDAAPTFKRPLEPPKPTDPGELLVS